jgi:hypothetical protein
MAKFKDLNLLDIGNTIQLTGAIWEGNGKCYLVFLPGDHNPDTTVEPLELTTGEWTQFIQQADVLETEVISKASDGTLAKIILRKSGRQIAQEVSWKVYHRDHYKCRYCGAGPGIPLTVDHLVLWEEGGPSIESNLLSSCKRCNRTRGNTQYEDWLRHPYYTKVSQRLTQDVLQANQMLAGTLARIPRMVHKPSKRK